MPKDYPYPEHFDEKGDLMKVFRGCRIYRHADSHGVFFVDNILILV